MPAGRAAVTGQGERVRYDALLVAVGAGSEPALRRALTWTPETDAELFGGLLRDLDEGYLKRVAFVVPPGVAWALPAYELAMMTAWQAWGMGHDDVEVTVYTPEDAPLGLFGTRATAALREDLEEAGVRAETGVYVTEDPREPRRLVLLPGERTLDVDRVVALPRAVGPALPGLPADARGFVPTDLYGRVPDVDGVWAAGDAIAFPVKQGGLAAQQADAAAESIASAAGADVTPQPFHPVLRGMMLTGRGKAWMRHEPAGGRAREPLNGARCGGRRPRSRGDTCLPIWPRDKHPTRSAIRNNPTDNRSTSTSSSRSRRSPTRCARRGSAGRMSVLACGNGAPRRAAKPRHRARRGIRSVARMAGRRRRSMSIGTGEVTRATAHAARIISVDPRTWYQRLTPMRSSRPNG